MTNTCFAIRIYTKGQNTINVVAGELDETILSTRTAGIAYIAIAKQDNSIGIFETGEEALNYHHSGSSNNGITAAPVYTDIFIAELISLLLHGTILDMVKNPSSKTVSVEFKLPILEYFLLAKYFYDYTDDENYNLIAEWIYNENVNDVDLELGLLEPHEIEDHQDNIENCNEYAEHGIKSLIHHYMAEVIPYVKKYKAIDLCENTEFTDKMVSLFTLLDKRI